MNESTIETILARALSDNGEYRGASQRPLSLATTHVRRPDGSFVDARIYGRSDNPTLFATEAVLREVENGQGALLFSSGLAAISTMLSVLGRNAHIITPRALYYGVEKWIASYGCRIGLTSSQIDQTDLSILAESFDRRRRNIVWIETPGNPFLDIIDIKQVVDIAKSIDADAKIVVDSSVATPFLQQPLNLGADYVVHSATKYLGGHSDILGGVLVTKRRDDAWRELNAFRYNYGNQLGAFDAWLLARSLETLAPRMRQISETGFQVAKWLEADPRISRVYYPGLEGHRNHDVAKRQMGGRYAGLISFCVCAGEGRAVEATNKLSIIKPETSFGGVQSSIEHHASVRDMYAAQTPISRALLRLSVGLENVDEIIADLDQAL